MHEAQILRNFKPLIDQIVRTAFSNSSVVDKDDLTQAASFAAVKAVKRHDASAGSTLRSYVASAIRRAVYAEASRFSGPFTLGRGVLSQAAKANKMQQAGKSELEIASLMGLELIEVSDLLSLYSIRTVSLDSAREELLV